MDYIVFLDYSSQMLAQSDGSVINANVGDPLFANVNGNTPTGVAEYNDHDSRDCNLVIEVANPGAEPFPIQTQLNFGFRFLTYNGKIAFIPDAP